MDSGEKMEEEKQSLGGQGRTRPSGGLGTQLLLGSAPSNKRELSAGELS